MPASAFIRALRGERQPLPPGPRVLPSELVEDVQRSRLVAGMAEAAAEKGYAATTIGDVVAHAQVSRRTFYEHFEDKDACFLAAYDASADLVRAIVAEAVESAPANWRERISAGIDAYLGTLASEPVLTRVFLVEIFATGPKSLAHRRAAHRSFAELMRGLVDEHRDELPEAWSLDVATATAIVGAMHELVLLAVEEGRTGELRRFTATVVGLVEAALALPSLPADAEGREQGRAGEARGGRRRAR